MSEKEICITIMVFVIMVGILCILKVIVKGEDLFSKIREDLSEINFNFYNFFNQDITVEEIIEKEKKKIYIKYRKEGYSQEEIKKVFNNSYIVDDIKEIISIAKNKKERIISNNKLEDYEKEYEEMVTKRVSKRIKKDNRKQTNKSKKG